MRLTIISCIKKLAFSSLLLLLTHLSYGNKTPDLTNIQATAQLVFDNLYTAAGNHLLLKPKLMVTETKSKVASFRPLSRTILLEVSAYRICQSLGKDSLDALAYILGHELAHSFQVDLNMQKESTNFLSYSKNIHTTYREEKTADIQGVFMAYLAGYKTKQVVKRVIEQIYKEYDLIGAPMSNYPSYKDRLGTAYEVEKIVKELIQFFELGNYLSSLNEYEYASACYEYIQKYFKGEEIHNNIGVNLLLHAINFTDENVDAYLYPIEIEWETRLKKPQSPDGTKDLNIDVMEYRIKMIKKAIKQFKNARKLNFSCFSCDINLISAYTLLGQKDQAINYYFHNNLDERVDFLRVPIEQREKVRIALAVAYADSKNDQHQIQARKIFRELIDSKNQYNASIAKYNLEVLENGTPKAPVAMSSDCILPFNTNGLVDGVQLDQFRSNQGKVINQKYDIRFLSRKYKGSDVFLFTKKGKEAFVFQRISKPRSEKFHLDNAGKNPKTISTTNGYFLICEEKRNIFLIEHNGNIKEWGIFFRE